MEIKFSIFGHENILGEHKTTFEFTKDSEVSKKGDCIIGVGADFSLEEIRQFLKRHGGGRVQIDIFCDGVSDSVTAELNPDFNDDREIVVRMSEHASERTLAVRADKSAKYLKRELMERMKERGRRAEVTIKLID